MVVIIGSGVVGASISYYLTKIDGRSPVTIIDAVGGWIDDGFNNGVASAFPEDGASTRVGAGAFLAESWGDGTKTESLHRRSFRLHSELAVELGISSYRTIPAYRVRPEAEAAGSEDGRDDDDGDDVAAGASVPWLPGVAHSRLPGNAAQVDPAELTGKLMRASIEKGAKSMVGTVVAFETAIEDAEDDESMLASNKAVTSIHLEDGQTFEVPPDESIVLAIGPWSSRMEDWLDVPMPIEGVWSTSLLWDPSCVDQESVRNYPAALFCDEDSNGCHLEILTRTDGSLYVSGCGGSKISSPAAIRAGAVRPGETNRPDATRAAAAAKSVRGLLLARENPDIDAAGDSASSSRSSPLVNFGGGKPQRRSCVRPVSPDASAVMGQVAGFKNVYVATGGGPWGITWAPAMGLSMARLLLDTQESPPINMRTFSPRRFDTMVYRILMEQRGKQAVGIADGEQQ